MLSANWLRLTTRHWEKAGDWIGLVTSRTCGTSLSEYGGSAAQQIDPCLRTKNTATTKTKPMSHAYNMLSVKGFISGMMDVTAKPDMSSENRIIQQILDGDTEAFETLIKNYQGRIFATARKYARRENEVEDIAQEVFLKAFRKLSSFRMDAPFEHWLMKIAVRTCYDYLRRHQRSKVASFTDISSDDFDLLEVVGEDQNDQRVQQEAAKAIVHTVMESLKPASRMVLTLQELEGKSVREIAQLTGWSVALVKVRAFRARKEMRQLLENIDHNTY